MPRVLVISSCTARKDERVLPADAIYLGEQHRRLMTGVSSLRSLPEWEVDLRIVSAQYGLIDAETSIEPYDKAFSGATRAEIKAAAEDLRLPQDVSAALRTRFELGLVALGGDYLTATGLDRGDSIETGGPTLVFCSTGAAPRLSVCPPSRVIPLEVGDTRRFSCGLVGLKGEVVGRVLAVLASAPSAEIPDWLFGDGLIEALSDISLQETRIAA